MTMQAQAPVVAVDGKLNPTTIVSITSLLPDVSKISAISITDMENKGKTPEVKCNQITPIAEASFDDLAGRTEYSIEKNDAGFIVRSKFIRYDSQGTKPGLSFQSEDWQVKNDGTIDEYGVVQTKYDRNQQAITTNSTVYGNQGAARCAAVVRDMLRNFPEKRVSFSLDINSGTTEFSVPFSALSKSIQLPEENFTNYEMKVTKKS